MMYKTLLTSLILVIFVVITVLVNGCENDSLPLQNQNEIEESAINAKTADGKIDQPDGFEVEVLAPHAPFSDKLAAQFRLKFAETGRETIVNNFRDASTMIIAEVTWEEAGSSSGWHLHPGIALVSMVSGEIEVTWDRDCVPRSYSAGDGWLDPGDIHNAKAVSDGAKAYVTFLGIPDGEPATEWVPPAECN